MGASVNTVTATKSRTAVYDKNIDATPGKLRQLLDTVRDFAQRGRAAGQEVFRQDVIIHGVRVRCRTNSPHLAEFWRLNWFTPEEWKAATGRPAPRNTSVRVYAFAGPNGEGGAPAAYYSRSCNTVVFFNTAYYGQLKSWVLGAVGRHLADTEGVHSIHGAAVKHGDSGVLFIAPTGTGKSTSSYGLMADALETFGPGAARFHSDDWVYVRYFFPTQSGDLVAPRQIRDAEGRRVARGFRCQAWLRHKAGHGSDRAGGPSAAARDQSLEVWGVTPAGEQVKVPLREFDPTKPPTALAYISEKTFYLRTNLVESYPAAAPPMTRTLLENVPDTVTAEEDGGRAAASAGGAGTAGWSPALDGVTAEDLARLAAFDNSRAMLTADSVFGREAVYTNPIEPLRLTHVFLLKREFDDHTVLTSLSLADFCGRLMLGRTPDGKAEVAYNAYRAVNDPVEAAYIGELRRLVDGSGLESDHNEVAATVFGAHLVATRNGRVRAKPVAAARAAAARASARLAPFEVPAPPDSLVEEFELFQTLHAATSPYLVNTILQSAPGIASRAEAVHATLKLFVAAMGLDHVKTRVPLEAWEAFVRLADHYPYGSAAGPVGS